MGSSMEAGRAAVATPDLASGGPELGSRGVLDEDGAWALAGPQEEAVASPLGPCCALPLELQGGHPFHHSICVPPKGGCACAPWAQERLGADVDVLSAWVYAPRKSRLLLLTCSAQFLGPSKV